MSLPPRRFLNYVFAWGAARLNPEVLTVDEWREQLDELPENASPRAREQADSKLADQEMALFRSAQEQLS